MIEFKEDVEALGARIVDDLRQELVTQGHNATGKLSQSLKHKVKVESNAIILTIDASYYAKWVEHGRRAGKRPPIEVLFNWVKTKGIASTDKRARSIAFAIATAIGRKGTPLRGSYAYSKNGRRKDFIKITLKKNKADIEGAVKLFGEKAIRTITKSIKKK